MKLLLRQNKKKKNLVAKDFERQGKREDVNNQRFSTQEESHTRTEENTTTHKWLLLHNKRNHEGNPQNVMGQLSMAWRSLATAPPGVMQRLTVNFCDAFGAPNVQRMPNLPHMYRSGFRCFYAWWKQLRKDCKTTAGNLLLRRHRGNRASKYGRTSLFLILVLLSKAAPRLELKDASFHVADSAWLVQTQRPKRSRFGWTYVGQDF